MIEEIHPVIHPVALWWDVMKGYINAFMVGDGKGTAVALIDSGPPQTSPEGMDGALRPHGTSMERVSHVLHTHGHIDHIGGDPLLRKQGDTQLMIHREDAVFLENRARSFDLAYRPGKSDAEELRHRFLAEIGPNLSVDRYLEDGDVIALDRGISLQVVHLPGHTGGSVGYYWEREGLLVCGDSLPGLGTRGGFLPIVEDLSSYIRSLDRVRSMALRTLVVGHRYRGIRLPPSLVRKGREIDEYLSDAKDVAMRLDEAICRHSAEMEGFTLSAVAERVVADLPPEMAFKKMSDLVGPDWSLATIAFALKATG